MEHKEHREHRKHMEHREHIPKEQAGNTSSGKDIFSTLDNRNSSTAAEETAAAFETALGYCFLRQQINNIFHEIIIK